MTTNPSEATPGVRSRRVAAFAMISIAICSIVGQLACLWWASRQDDTFVKRWALSSLALEALDVAAVVLGSFCFAILSAVAGEEPLVALVPLVFAWLIRLTVSIIGLALAVSAWRGNDPGSSRLMPSTLAERLPAEEDGW